MKDFNIKDFNGEELKEQYRVIFCSKFDEFIRGYILNIIDEKYATIVIDDKTGDPFIQGDYYEVFYKRILLDKVYKKNV